MISLVGSTSSLSELWREGLLCDVTLSASDGSVYPCHRVVLASGSGYFRALFTGAGSAMLEGSCDKIILEALTGMELEAALNALYNLQIQVMRCHVASLVAGCVRLCLLQRDSLKGCPCQLTSPPLVKNHPSTKL